jgi:hypothetical protein
MGLAPDSAPGKSLPEQLTLIWQNLRTILAETDMTVDNIVRLTSYRRGGVERPGPARVERGRGLVRGSIRQHRTSSPVNAEQDRRALSLPLSGSEGEDEVRATDVENDPMVSSPALTENEAVAVCPTGMEAKSHTTPRLPSRTHPVPLAQASPAA